MANKSRRSRAHEGVFLSAVVAPAVARIAFLEREQKSSKVRHGPFFSLLAMADSMALAWMSGGNTGISIRRHSAITTARRSVLFAWRVSMADMNSRGKWAFR